MNVMKQLPNLIGGISLQPAPTRLANQCEDQKNFICSPALGLTVRPSLKFRSASVYNDGGAFFTLDRDADTQHNLWISPNGLRVEDLNGNVQNIEYQGSARAYLALPEGADPRESYKILPVADSCFIVNRTVVTKTDPNSFTVRKNQALIHIKQVNYGTTWSVSLNGHQVNFGYDSDANQSISTQEVATSLVNSLLAISEISQNFDIDTASSVIYIRRKDGEAFSVGVADTRSNTYSSLTTYKIKDFTDLPTIAPDGFTCCISGNNGSTADDYYVRFRATGELAPYTWIDTSDGVESHEITGYFDPSKINSYTPIKVGTKVSCTSVPSFTTMVKNISYGRWTIITFADRFPSNPGNLTYAVERSNTGVNLAHGVWEECEAPDLQTEFDASTMPHVLVHDIINNTWVFRPVEWDGRLAGDDESAPFPSFINKPITALFMFRNRLGIVAGDSVSMSAAGDLECFFPETVQTLTDAAPIDISVSVDDYSDILATVAVQENLMFWSKKRQYTLSTPDTLSPKTAAILPSTAYTCLPDAGLPVIGSKIYFVDADNQNDQVYEYAVDAVSATKEGMSVTAHVPDLIKHKSPVMLTGSQTSSVIALFNNATPDTVWLYQFYVNGDQKLQSAWSRQVIDGTIKNIAFRGSELWLEIIHNGQRIMATMDFMTKRSRSRTNYTPSLDYFIEYENPGTTIKLPFNPVTSKFVVLVPNGKGEYTPTKSYALNNANLTVRKYDKVYVGERFERYYEFSECWHNTGTKTTDVSLSSGRMQLRRWTLNYTQSGSFDVIVKDKIRGLETVYPFDASLQLSSILGSPLIDSGSFGVPCRGRNDEIAVAIKADNWLPQTFLSACVYMNYTRHTRTI